MRLPPFKLERFFARYEFNAPYLLCSSDCESVALGDLLGLEPDAFERFSRLGLGYTESPGSPELRREIARLYERVEPDEVLVHTGAEEAIFSFMNVALSAGDHLIVHSPAYQSLAEVARSLGCEVTLWATREEDAWELDLDFLRRSLRPNTRAIVVNCPHNPTGYQMSGAKQAEIVTIARENDLLLFSDEVYRLLEHDPAQRLPAACDLYERAVSLGVMSKAYGLAGLRIGWIATRDAELRAAMASFKDYTTICNSAPSEFLATLALRQADALLERNRAIIARNLTLLDDFFSRNSRFFKWVRPGGGSTGFPSLITGQPIEEFCHDLVQKQGVLLLPGDLFDYGSRNFRLGYGRQNMPLALVKLEEFLQG